MESLGDTGVMADPLHHLDWALGRSNIYSNLILGVSVKVFEDE